MLGFQVFWNLLCGVPMLMPSFFYQNHIDHHKSHHYGTERDGEYLPLGARSVHHILLFLAQAPVLPIYIYLRLLLSPLTFVLPRVRQWTLEHASSFVINYRHRLSIPKRAPRRVWALLLVGAQVRRRDKLRNVFRLLGYLDVVLLRLCRHTGKYGNRVGRERAGQLDQMP